MITRTTRFTRPAVHAAVFSAVLLAVPAAHAAPQEGYPVAEVTASDHDGNVPANTLDNDLGTRWSAHGDGAWIRYDLGTAKAVAAVAIAWRDGDVRTAYFDIETSQDGTTWVPAAVGLRSRPTLAQEPYDIPDVTTRYVRVVGHGNSSGNGWNSVTEVDVLGADAPGGGCTRPSDVLDLANWKITLPVDDPNRSGSQPLEVRQPQLDGYALDPWFVPAPDCAGVRFRNPVNGLTTQNSSYSRSELREMTDGGSASAAWSSTSGTHTMVVDQAINHLPNDKPHVVAGQIHDSDDDVAVFRLEGTKLYVTNGDTTHHKLITDNYALGTRFQAKFVVSGGQVKAYYNGVLQTTISRSFSGAYFKAGVYTQANCGNSSPCDSGNYGEVTIYGVTVTHS
ncbi:polysaccharide lyase family 7 protein [Saccharothrix syringae]|uniref:Alginate lyase n=1 Tax=Saccharothrix syringae TaxID=103733 RepID=A0A5Q0H0K8_SACSY|nr:polysaccharide lyase family 7 protein [Saccharothrix syringae]QFZ19738.1 alginate lyase [Saccharothrix syringae]